MMARRTLLMAAWAARYCFAQAAAGRDTLRGRLVQTDGQARLQILNGHVLRISGDGPTEKILHDSRLSGKEFEVKGHLSGADAFAIDPIETRPMVVVEGAKRSRVTYYCDVCSIRTYSPGPCMCCQAETRLDLIDPASNS